MNSNQKSPLYFNLQSVRPYNQDSNVAADVNFKPGQINIFNDTPFLKDSDQYYIGVQRALIPVSYVPRLIVPVVLGPVDNGPINTNPDLLVYKISLAYRNAAGVVITQNCSSNVIFQSEVQGGLKPRMDGQIQDFTQNPYYYFVYDINTMLISFNQTIQLIWGKFVVYCSNVGVNISACRIPYFGFNESTNKFFFVADNNFFNQDPIITYDSSGNPTVSPVARCEFFTDSLISDLTQVPSRYYYPDARQGNDNLINQLRVSLKDGCGELDPITNLITMLAWKSSLNMWNAATKIVFTVNYGIPTKLEYQNQQNSSPDGVLSIPGQPDTNNQYVRPIRPTLTDIQVNVNEFSFNNNYIQFSSSSITQIRLIDIITRQDLKDFSLSVSWVSNFGRSYDLVTPVGHPLELKLAFYPKSTTLI